MKSSASMNGARVKRRALSSEVSLVRTQRSRNKVFAREKDDPTSGTLRHHRGTVCSISGGT